MIAPAINTTPNHAITADYDGEDFFLVAGTLSELQVARSKVNLLAQIEKNLQTKNLASDVAAVVSGMYGMVANSASLALYDGEDMYNFAAVVGDHILCGTFEHADQFKRAKKAVEGNFSLGDHRETNDGCAIRGNVFPLLNLMPKSLRCTARRATYANTTSG